ncbi:MAG: CDP-alcohol phosphatidyltransferase family protein [Muribaculaceae bacterium]|nr:CDP-alcohol phosphatidyltransferase family protein [Muribaculaceae bacterium]
MRALPNILSSLRIVGAIGLLFCDVTSVVFWGIYLACGISDMADGWLARKFDCATKTGALLDSVADICFVACCGLKLLPVFELPLWLWIWAGVIVVIKIANQVLALLMSGKCSFPHTIANKVTGFLLFIAVPMTFWSIIPLAIVAVVATFAAVQEGYFIRGCQSAK